MKKARGGGQGHLEVEDQGDGHGHQKVSRGGDCADDGGHWEEGREKGR